MTSYFDAATSAVSSITHDVPNIPDLIYVQTVQRIEAPVIQIVLANACDREFPDDLRRKICRVIANEDYNHAYVDGRQIEPVRRLIAVRHSELITSLHSIFHDLARRRAPLRGTTWSDSPTQNLTTIASDPAATDCERLRHPTSRKFRTTPAGEPCDVCNRVYCDHVWKP